MIEIIIEWFLSRPKYERVLFIIDVLLFLAFLCVLGDFLTSDLSASSGVIL